LVLINMVPGIRAISINSSGVSFTVSGTEASLNFGGRIAGGEDEVGPDEVDELRPRTDFHRDTETVGEDGGGVNGFIIDRLLMDMLSSNGSSSGIAPADVAVVAEVDGREMISPVIGPVVRLLVDFRRLNARRSPLLTVLWRFTSGGGG